jgi:hypothetical protein
MPFWFNLKLFDFVLRYNITRPGTFIRSARGKARDHLLFDFVKLDCSEENRIRRKKEDLNSIELIFPSKPE